MIDIFAQKEKVNSKILCADIGGSHITAAIVDLQTRSILQDTVERKHIHSDAPAQTIIDEWCSVFEDVIHKNNLNRAKLKIGLAMPGPFDYEGGISYIKGLGKYEALYGLNVKELVSKKLGVQADAVRFKNDAASFLHGEVLAGAAQGFEHVIGFTLGTGIGTARYHSGVAEDADLWRLPYRGTFSEEFLATRWFLKRYHELTGKTVQDVKQLVSYYDTDPAVPRIFEEFSVQLTDFLVKFIEMDSPEVIVIGGNISKASNLFLDNVTSKLKAKALDVPFRKALLGEWAAMLGAACCWTDAVQYTSR